ncbi:MAG: YhjD/YihY/BrkB family envelope integrity protein, partial [Nitrospirales bacterium]|nr:YhjD/YihY/BrkB family envelope integrity protein [Nitrospirales bacterium]
YFSFYSSSLYGAAGSLVVLLLWFYYSAQIFMYGAEFTYMYATRYGSQIVPAAGAEQAGRSPDVDGAENEKAGSNHFNDPAS